MTIIHSFFDPSSRWYYPLRWLVIILLGWAVYAQTFGYGFVFDDNYFILNTPYIRSFEKLNQIWAFLPKTRLLGVYSLALNYRINQLHPQGYHIFNFFIHLLATGLVWGFAGMLFKVTKRPSQELPFVIALLFLVHPCQTQAVSYISQRFESMATVFYIGSIYSYIAARMSPSKRHRILLFTCSAVFAVLGIFTKEVAVTIPLMLLAAEFILFNKNPLNLRKVPSRDLYLLITVLGVLFVLLFMKIVRYGFIQEYFHFSAPSESHDGDMITVGNYFLTQMRVFLTFLRLLILPIHQSVDYDYPVSTGLFGPPLTFVGLCSIGFIAFLVFRLRRQWPLISFGLAWILITFSINTAPRIYVIFEHKLYLISFGFFLAAVCTLSTIIKDRKILLGLLITLIAVLSLVSYKRNHVWKNEFTLWNDVALKSPRKARPYDGLGVFYGKQGDSIQALYYFNKAIAMNSDYAEAYNNRGNTYAKLGRYAQALSDLNKAIEIDPNYAQAYANRANLYESQGHVTQALSDYNKAIDRDSYYTDAYYNRGILYESQGQSTQALSDYNKAIDINPNVAEAYIFRGNIYDKEGDLAQAQADYNKAIAINPDIAEVYYSRGLDFAKQGYFTQAISDFNNAIKINPKNAEAYINRGVIFAQQSDFALALSDDNKAIDIDPYNANAYSNRGTFYAQQGSFIQALSDYNKAIELNPGFGEAYFNRAVIFYQLKEYDHAWGDVNKAERSGTIVNPKFINALERASGRDQ